MGQMYRALIGNVYGKRMKVFEYHTREECICTKLMEHSWLANEFVNNVSALLYNIPGRLCWVGQYADNQEFKNLATVIPSGIVTPIYEDAWDNDIYCNNLEYVDFSITDKYLVNYDKEEYIDISEYMKKSYGRNNGIIHPLPLITNVGNGKGLGDFHKGNLGYEYVGIWCWQLIAFTDKPPRNYLRVNIRYSELDS